MNEDRIDALEREINSLRAEVAELRAQVSRVANRPDPMRPIGPGHTVPNVDYLVPRFLEDLKKARDERN